VQKLSELNKHDKAVDSGIMTKEDFLARYLVGSDATPLCSSLAANTELKNDEVLSEEVAV
jgi:hypothetical protein